MSNLRLINETEVASGVSSVNIDNVFSADFDIYKIVGNVVNNSSTSVDVHLRLINSSGSVITTSTIDYALLRLYTDGSEGNFRATNIDKFNSSIGVVQAYPRGAGFVAYLFNPFSNSSYTFMLVQSMQAWSNDTQIGTEKGIYVQKELISATGFNAYPNSTAFGIGTVFQTYGLRVDS